MLKKIEAIIAANKLNKLSLHRDLHTDIEGDIYYIKGVGKAGEKPFIIDGGYTLEEIYEWLSTAEWLLGNE